ncbi:MAG TPA: hypothetical protein VFG87_20140, partial [Amycolatopsis sp.]|nr:hypothetical protein [Amycolatopsis sp.]
RQPGDGLQARFSAYHAAAVGLLDGRVALRQFSDERAVMPDVERLRTLITLVPTESCARDAATIRIERAGASPVSVHIPHARGSLARPLTDAELFAKVDGLVEPVLGAGAARALAEAVDEMESALGLGALLMAIRPAEQEENR